MFCGGGSRGYNGAADEADSREGTGLARKGSSFIVVRTVLTALILTALATGLPACASRVRTPNTLRIAADTEPAAMDPHLVSGYTEHRILTSLFEGLTTLNQKTLAVEPGAAESWSVSDDGLVYTFKINPNAKWSNGTPVTARDFVYGWKRHLSPKLASEYSYMLWCLKNAEAYNKGQITDFNEVGAKALDDATLEATLAYPAPYFLSMQIHYSWFPVLQSNIEQFGKIDDRISKWTRAGNMVSNGPFKLVEWTPDQLIRAERNEYYWNAANVKLDAVEFYPTKNMLTEERSFKSGRVHTIETLLATKIQTYRKKNPSVLRIEPFIGTYFYRFNVTRPPLDNPLVRRALSMAIDRQSISENVMYGAASPAVALTPPNLAGYTAQARVDSSIEEARRLLAEAGYPNGQGMRPIEILFNESEDHERIAEAIQDMWKKNLNVQVVTNKQEWKVYLDTMNTLGYDVVRSAWIADYLDPMNYMECFVTDGGNNRTGWSSKPYDSLVEQARYCVDPVQRYDLLQQAEAILLDESPIAPIYTYKLKYLVSPEVQGYDANPMGYLNYRYFSLVPGTL